MPECICTHAHGGRMVHPDCPAAGRWIMQAEDGRVLSIFGPHGEEEARESHRQLRGGREAVTVKHVRADWTTPTAEA